MKKKNLILATLGALALVGLWIFGKKIEQMSLNFFKGGKQRGNDEID